MRYIKQEITGLVRAKILPGSRILDVGCGDGTMLRDLLPATGMGIDVDERAISVARSSYPQLGFICSSIEDLDAETLEPFDYVVLSGVLEQVHDVYVVLAQLRSLVSDSTRLVVVSYSRLWQPAVRVAELLRLRKRTREENWIPPNELVNLPEQSGFCVVTKTAGVLIPINLLFLSRFVNRWLAPLPLIRQLAAVTVTVARPTVGPNATRISPRVSVVIAARNESGNIRSLVRRLPQLSDDQEVIFVEGHSTDGTWEQINMVIAEQSHHIGDTKFRAIKQPGIGRGDAIRAGLEVATGDILITMCADLSVPPEELPRFIECLRNGVCEFANGSRLLYPMEDKAMQFLNIIGNRIFGIAFTFLFGQQIRDTLCGTKVLWARDYRRIVANRSYFGDFDPFGDFDLLFGASRLGLHIRDVPVHYKARTYGSTKISRFRHGLLLLRMTVIAARRIRFT